MGRKMKDSGIEWIGEIPEDWKIVPLKRLCSMEAGKTLSSNEIAPEGEFRVFGGNGLRGYYEQYNHEGKCLLIGRQGALCGNVHKVEGKFWATEHAWITKKTELVAYDYLFALLNGMNLNQYASNAAAQPGLSVGVVANIKTVLPDMEEQIRISDVLREKCDVIDKLIVKNQDIIKQYKSLKQSLITRAVTKGIRGEREMKDSGIEWIGRFPSDWELRPFRYILKERQEKNAPIKSKERLSLSIDLGVTLYAEKTTNLDRFKDDFEQYKLAYPGDLVMNSMNMIVGASGVSDYFGCVSPVYYTFYDDTANHVTAKFCEYIFRSRAMMRVLFSMGKGIYAIVRGDDRVNTCRLKVSKEDLKSLKLPLPSLDEQQEIVTYLDQKLSDIDTLIAKKEQLLSELETYKKSLIYEYVTGKREVPA